MKIKKSFLPIGILFLSCAVCFYNCGRTTSTQSSTPQSSTNGTPSATTLQIQGNEVNVMPVSVGCFNANSPCVSVTICKPGGIIGTNNCQTVNNILLDTGSYGLRVFLNQLPANNFLSLIPDPATHLPLGECVVYGDGSSTWGPLARADVVLGNGNLRAANIPVQVIDSVWAARPSSCMNPATSPAQSLYNGILGVGLLLQDCGDYCVNTAANDTYFACTSGTCSSTAVATALQVVNPVSQISGYNNGVILQFPSVPSTGAVSDNGWMVLGISTSGPLAPPATGVSVYPADQYANFVTQFMGTEYSDSNQSLAFIDSGSNAYYFPDPGLTLCADANYFFCPAALTTLSATVLGVTTRSAPATVGFQIGNADTLLSASSPNLVFDNLGGPGSGMFDFGFPFFLGRTVYVGFEGGTHPALGTGPYWAF